MTDDAIVAEVRKARRDILESYGWDFVKMSRDTMRRQGQSGHRLVSCPDTPAGAADQRGAQPAHEKKRKTNCERNANAR